MEGLLSEAQSTLLLEYLPDDILYVIFEFLPSEDLETIIFLSDRFIDIFRGSSNLLRRAKLVLRPEIVEVLLSSQKLQSIAFKNVVVAMKVNTKQALDKILKVLSYYSGSLENLELTSNFTTNKNYWKEVFNATTNIKKLKLTGCSLANINGNEPQIFPELQSLDLVEFEKCDVSCFYAFKGHLSLRKLAVTNNDFTVKGFEHSKFIELIKTLNVQHLTFKGIGTGTFFENCYDLLNVPTVEAETITFNWYIGMEDYPRINFLQAQQDYLKHLTINQLPNDYDGGKIMRYILEEMNLQTFKYGDISLIQHGQKCDVKTIWANEIQLGSLFVLMKHYKNSIECLQVFQGYKNGQYKQISPKIDEMVNEMSDLFQNIKVVDMFDRGSPHSNEDKSFLRLLLGLLRQLRNVEFLSITTQDRNINVILEEFLPRMGNLKEIYLTSTALRHEERFEIIQSILYYIIYKLYYYY